MMTQPTLTVEKHYLNWPLNRPLNQADIMHELGVHASDETGQDLTSKVMMNLTQVDVKKTGEYPVMLSVMDNNGQSTQVSITLNIQPMRTQNATHKTKVKTGMVMGYYRNRSYLMCMVGNQRS